MADHFILKCSQCGTVIAQCRCADLNKMVRYQVCSKCLWPANLPLGPANISGVHHTRSVEGQGPHFAGNPPLHDLTIAENGESNEGFME